MTMPLPSECVHLRKLAHIDHPKLCFTCCTLYGSWKFGDDSGYWSIGDHEELQICEDCITHLLQTNPKCPICRADLHTGDAAPPLHHQEALTAEELEAIALDQQVNPQVVAWYQENDVLLENDNGAQYTHGQVQDRWINESDDEHDRVIDIDIDANDDYVIESGGDTR
ncbi:hypothetical protein ACIQMR_31680 [Streptomyces sp. NPDC091376]|uniref:hypothetical protein n=1 Tax=Streptomyces sp. NPDC091376 TaxID=3365994 RepID=UPI003824D911